MRFEAVFRGPPPGARTLAFRDDNYADRIGWKEIVVNGAHGATVDQLRAGD